MQLIGWYVDGIQPDSYQSILFLFFYGYNNKYILLQLYLILRMSDTFLHNTFLVSLIRKIFLYVSFLYNCHFGIYIDIFIFFLLYILIITSIFYSLSSYN